VSDWPLTALGIVRARRGQADELGRRMAALLGPTRAEAGCLAYELFQSDEDPTVWVLIERWRSVTDLDAHVLAEHMVRFLARSHEVLDGPPENFRLRPMLPSTVPAESHD
jgi:quinol monooxygenase YgiN